MGDFYHEFLVAKSVILVNLSLLLLVFSIK